VSIAYKHHSLASGAYTLPDAARLLGLPLARIRAWVRGTAEISAVRYLPAGPFSSRAEGRDRHVDFYTLIELFTLAELRRLGVSMKTLKANRTELSERFSTSYPFALRGLLTDGRRLLRELGEQVLLELGSGGQSAFEAVVAPFCHRLDFDASTELASRYFPLGRKIPVVVSPAHAFGRPVIVGTNLPTETIASLVRGGESLDDIAVEYQLSRDEVDHAWRFEERRAA
jgi:uncharacterized protein (DUF433 family)